MPRGVTDLQSFDSVGGDKSRDSRPLKQTCKALFTKLHDARGVRARRDHRPDAGVVKMVTHGVALVAIVGNQVAGSRLGECAERFELCAVGRLAAGAEESEREAGGIAEIASLTD